MKRKKKDISVKFNHWDLVTTVFKWDPGYITCVVVYKDRIEYTLWFWEDKYTNFGEDQLLEVENEEYIWFNLTFKK